MPLTAEDKTEIAKVVEETMDRRRERMMRDRLPDPPKEKRLYLISFAGHALGLPDPNNRVVMTSAIYARVEVNPDRPSFYQGEVEIVADGDGRQFPAPYRTILTGVMVTGLVEMPDRWGLKLTAEGVREGATGA
jgi:hypothetical protein